ncbi:hypothetical protein CKO27_19520 [Thiocystis violacea]|nr:hypothetical protein [Thiocystis violacea]
MAAARLDLDEPSAPARPEARTGPPPEPPARAGVPVLESAADWPRLAARLTVGGIASQLAHNCGFSHYGDGRLTLTLDPAAEHLRAPSALSRLQAALEQALGEPLKLEIQVDRPRQETLAQRRSREADERQRVALDTMREDPVAHALQEGLEADWVPGSIRSAD